MWQPYLKPCCRQVAAKLLTQLVGAVAVAVAVALADVA